MTKKPLPIMDDNGVNVACQTSLLRSLGITNMPSTTTDVMTNNELKIREL
ncbi:MAG: hypothetical protein OXH84_07195 [Gammaproteobacteria bacterium]|nr:hypothetical protein [Gammaproteobacteria bacterium]